MATRINVDTIKTDQISQYIKCFDAIDGRYKCKVEQCHSALSKNSAAIRHLKNSHQDVAQAIDDCKKEQSHAGSIEVKSMASLEMVWNAILQIIVFGAIPFSFLTSKGFQFFIRPYAIAFHSAGIDFSVNRVNTQSKIGERAKQVKEIIRTEVNGKMVCLLLDIASRFNRSIFGINIAYFHNGKVRVRTIGMETLKITHTGRNLYEIVKRKLSELGISIQQVFTVTTDNGRNLIKLSKLLKKELFDSEECERLSDDETDDDDEELANNDVFGNDQTIEQTDEHIFDPEIFNDEYFDDLLGNVRMEFDCSYDGLFQGISCAAHGLHLIVTDAVRKCHGTNALIERCRTMAKKLRTPNLRATIKENGKKSPILDVKTRWSSIFNMVRKYVNKRLRV